VVIIISNFFKKYKKTIISIIIVIVLFLGLYIGNVRIEKIELSIAILTLSSLILNFFNMDKDKNIQEEIRKYEKLWQDSSDVKRKKEDLMLRRNNVIEEIKVLAGSYKQFVELDIANSKENKKGEISLNLSVVNSLQRINTIIDVYKLVIKPDMIASSQEIKAIIDSRNTITYSELQTINKNVDSILLHADTL